MKINQEKVEKAVRVLESLRDSGGYQQGFPKEMKGDISSFGASIIQAGLLPSVLFFSEGRHDDNRTGSDEDTKKRRAQLMKAIFDIIGANPTNFAPERPLLDYVRQHLGSASALDDITEAALALKVAMRAFAFTENNPPSNEPSST